ncbi:hypothetical protein C3B59_17370 [Cryobacterium zongtaii]|uniref:NYN domain-containing protein n=1 Tax=Cryobacterium zongtaii TaxID=1259217 RepID=A0A2S3Z6B6_9MICO|nr:NYN domain-containing protein [Cryobacterium zongtaii]POH59662.1 hypothetical protein C3B59_17370 [Cryobacterium zongtaii]
MTRVAVFLDVDNVLPFASSDLPEILHGTARDRISAHAVLAELEELVQSFGDVVIREAYGRWDNAARYAPAVVLDELGYRLRHMPPLSVDPGETHGLKNAADILLAVRSVLARDQVTVAVLVAMDSDYQPLVAELKAGGVTVVGVGFERPGRQAYTLRETLDVFVALTPVPGWEAISTWRRTGVVPGAVTPLAPRLMPEEQMIPAQPRPPARPTPAAAVSSPAPPAPSISTTAVTLSTPRVFARPAPVPMPERPTPRDPSARVRASAVGETLLRVLPPQAGSPIIGAAFDATLASFGLRPLVRTTVLERLESAGWMRPTDHIVGPVIEPTDSWLALDDLRRTEALIEALVLGVMTEAARQAARSDNPLDSRIAYAREILDTTLDVPTLVRLALAV